MVFTWPPAEPLPAPPENSKRAVLPETLRHATVLVIVFCFIIVLLPRNVKHFLLPISCYIFIRQSRKIALEYNFDFAGGASKLLPFVAVHSDAQKRMHTKHKGIRTGIRHSTLFRKIPVMCQCEPTLSYHRSVFYDHSTAIPPSQTLSRNCRKAYSSL